ncbi:MAG: PDZ domain-containing protein [Pirellulales bacterium]
MHASPITASRDRRRAALGLIACLIGGIRADSRADEQAPPAAPFAPGDISIGEPIALPFAKPKASAPESPSTAATPSPATPQAPMSVLTQPLAAIPEAKGPATGGSTAMATGWLGMAVAESRVPGRWAIVDIAANGPAAAAGIRAGDELRSINGTPLASGDEVAQAITAIAAGQQVRLAVARGDQVSDVDLVAVPRPTTATAPQWQASAPPAAAPQATASVLAPTQPTATPAPAPVTTLPPAAAPARMPAPALSATAAPAAPGRGRTALGVRTVPIDPDIQARFRLPAATGAYVVGVVGDLPASKAGIPPGSVIVRLGDQAVRSPQELTALVTVGPLDRPIPVEYVLPGGTGKRADVVLQSLEHPLEAALVEEGVQPSGVPTLDPGPLPQTARRPVAAETEARELRREVGRLRGLLEAFERRLDRIGR